MTTGNEVMAIQIKSITENIYEIKGDIRVINEVIKTQSETLIKQNVVLDEHIRRTEALEKKVENQEKFQNRAIGAFIILQIAVPIAIKLIIK